MENVCVNRSLLAAGFKSLGLQKNDTILVHSRMSSFGYVEGGANTVIDSLLDVLYEGTVAVPTLTGDEKDGPDCPPVCDVRNTPCWTGRIPETLRQDARAIRSLHPTHSVAAIGDKAKELTEGHEKSFAPCDEFSPYYKLAQMNGYVLLLGVGQVNNTTMHCVEEIADVPYHLQKEFTKCKVIDYTGKEIIVNNRLHSWAPPHADFSRIEPILIEKRAIKFGQIGNCVVRLVSAGRLLEIGVDLLKKDPYFLVK